MIAADYTNGQISEDLCGTLEAAQAKGNRGQGVIVPFDATQITPRENRCNPKSGDPCHPLAASAHAPAIAFQERGRKGGRNLEVGGEGAYALTSPSDGGRHQERNIQDRSRVRRLTPREYERLQGFPDDWTLIMYSGKPAADGPRYEAIGNSMAVPVLRWIGERIAAVERAASRTTGERAGAAGEVRANPYGRAGEAYEWSAGFTGAAKETKP